MYIKRVYNNNVVMVDDAGTERIAVGKGIAFGRKRGDVLDSASFEKVFTLDDPTQLSRLERLIKAFRASTCSSPRTSFRCFAANPLPLSMTTFSSL